MKLTQNYINIYPQIFTMGGLKLVFLSELAQKSRICFLNLTQSFEPAEPEQDPSVSESPVAENRDGRSSSNTSLDKPHEDERKVSYCRCFVLFLFLPFD